MATMFQTSNRGNAKLVYLVGAAYRSARVPGEDLTKEDRWVHCETYVAVKAEGPRDAVTQAIQDHPDLKNGSFRNWSWGHGSQRLFTVYPMDQVHSFDVNRDAVRQDFTTVFGDIRALVSY